MILFKQGIDSIATVNSIDQLLTYENTDIPLLWYDTDAAEIPTIEGNPGKFLCPNNNWPVSSTLYIGAGMTYSKTNRSVSIGGVDFNTSNLPTSPARNADTVLYYQPTATGLKVLVTSKVWGAETENGAFISDVNTLQLVLYNGASRDIYGPVTLSGNMLPSGDHSIFTMDVNPLDTTKLVDESVIIDTLNQQFFGKEWVEAYIDKKLEQVIPKAVDQAVKEAETVIQQRYVSR